MRKAAPLTLGAVLTSLIVAGGIAWAANAIQCPNPATRFFPDECHGTDSPDVLIGTHGPDEILG